MKLLPKLQVAEGLRIPNSFGYLTAHLNILFKTHLSALSKEKAQNIAARCRNWRSLLTILSPHHLASVTVMTDIILIAGATAG